VSHWLLGDVITLLGSEPQVKDILQIKTSFSSPVVTSRLLRQVISGRNYLNCHMKLLHIKQLTQRKLSKCIIFFIFILGTIKSLKKQNQGLTILKQITHMRLRMQLVTARRHLHGNSERY
jgi:hypothetical protein